MSSQQTFKKELIRRIREKALDLEWENYKKLLDEFNVLSLSVKILGDLPLDKLQEMDISIKFDK
ncbi:MAG: hypothetical protein JSW11_00830 [Candidatus Heimdallarchaeota archaeon]|nr:MAG: hypothetical protein JSW11_00830 [Candidatus Heimdallarchaeota archaeon]